MKKVKGETAKKGGPGGFASKQDSYRKRSKLRYTGQVKGVHVSTKEGGKHKKRQKKATRESGPEDYTAPLWVGDAGNEEQKGRGEEHDTRAQRKEGMGVGRRGTGKR